MRKTIFYLLFSFLFLTQSQVFAQSQLELMNSLSVEKIKKLSDAELLNLVDKAQEQGYDQSYIESVARLKGISEEDITYLRNRIEALQGNKSVSTSIVQEEVDQPKASPSKPSKNDSDALTVFGSDLFNNTDLTFSPSLNVPTPSTYELGVGDEVIIDIWGTSQKTFKLVIDKSGNVNIENLGPIYLNGLSIESAQKRLENRLSEIYEGLRDKKQSTFALLTLGNLRSVKVNMVGELKAPGTYVIPSMSSVFNALYLAGGPTKDGSFREIKVIRNNKLVASLDIYDFLTKGVVEKTITLKDQDIVKVDFYKNRIKLEGAFIKTGLFELKDGESLADLINYSGGFSDKAYRNKVDVERVGKEQKVFFSLDAEQFATFKLENGDIVSAGVIDEKIDNRILINGAVVREGYYEYEEGITLKQLVDLAKGLKADAYLDRAIIVREKEDLSKEMIAVPLGNLLKADYQDFPLQPNDNIWINSIEEMVEKKTVSIKGEVIHPNQHDFVEGMTLKDIILLSGGFTDAALSARIEVSRRIYNTNNEGEIAKTYTISLKDGIAYDEDIKNFVLEPFDQIFVRKNVNYHIQDNVQIKGEVMYEGAYTLASESEKISDVINRAGGLKKNAYVAGASLYRKDENNQVYNIAIDLEKILKNPSSIDNLFLEKGDELYVPKIKQVVHVDGAVQNANALAYSKDSNLLDYVEKSGGFETRAIRRKTYVKYVNGHTDVVKSFLWFKKYPKIEPGAKIIVPEKPVKEGKPASFWLGISTSVASLALIIASIIAKN